MFSTFTIPAVNSEPPLCLRAFAAPSSTVIRPLAATANPIQSLRADTLILRAGTAVPIPEIPAIASARTLSLSAAAITVRTPLHDAILAAASFEAIPPLPLNPALPATSWSDSSIAAISSIRVASGSRRGSAVSKPGVSVRRTNRSARIRFATSAAMRSLSPYRIASSATASFSLTMGTTLKRNRCVNVASAWRY